LSTKKWARRLDDVAPDAGDVILSWLTRVVLVIAVTAVVGFDGLSIAVAHVSAQDDANSAAVAAATAWVSDKGALAPTLLAAQNSAVSPTTEAISPIACPARNESSRLHVLQEGEPLKARRQQVYCRSPGLRRSGS